MKKRTPRKLQLNRETLRYLVEDDLRKAAGLLPTTPLGSCVSERGCDDRQPDSCY